MTLSDLRIIQSSPLWFRISCCALLCWNLAGCGGSSPAPSQPTTNGETYPPTESNVQESGNQTQASIKPTVDPKRKETKWIGDIPYDVFYDQPLTIAADNTAVASNATSNNAPSTGTETTTEKPMASDGGSSGSSGAASSDVNWSEVIPMPFLVAEIKRLRTQLTQNLQTVATYNRATNQIALDGAMLSAMAAVAEVHPEDNPWKANAKFVRDLGYEVYMNADGTGREPWTATKEPFEFALTVLDGGATPDITPEDKVPFSDVVYMSEIMKQIELSFNNLKANINTEDRLKEDPAAVEREIRVLLTLGTMMGTDSYSYTEEKKYQAFVKRFVDGAKQSADAVKTGLIDDFQAGLNAIQTTCAECHTQYRGSDTGF